MSDEDDYMSADFVVKDIQPGISKNRQHQRFLKQQSHREHVEHKNRNVPKKHELEKAKREEALAKPVCETSKGFALLAKMGFKPGMSLGKKKDEHDLGSGIKEPIGLELKADRTGLGHKTEETSKRNERLQAEIDKMRNNARNADQLIEEYRKRKMDGSSTRQLIIDILKSRTSCFELDNRLDIQLPVEPWFWKSYVVRESSLEDPPIKRRYIPRGEDDEEDEERRYTYSNGSEAPKETRFDEFTDSDLEIRLSEITKYLREKHFYCIWCGCQYSDTEDLKSCPGDSRELHDCLEE